MYLLLLNRLGSFCGTFSAVGLLISSVDVLSLCCDDGCCIDLYAVSMSVFDAGVCVEPSL